MTHRCEQIMGPFPYHGECGRPAKYKVFMNNRSRFLCGLHIKESRRWISNGHPGNITELEPKKSKQ